MTRRMCAAAIAVLLLVGCGAEDRDRSDAQTAAPAPGPIISPPAPEDHDPLAPAHRAAARNATSRFLAGYLPYLYGRREASEVAPVTAPVARTLRASRARVTPAQAARRPRVQHLEIVGQSARSALATATVADGGPAPYRLTITLERRDGAWVIAGLGDDR